MRRTNHSRGAGRWGWRIAFAPAFVRADRWDGVAEQLIHNHLDHVPFRGDFPAQSGEGTGMKDEFFEQGGDIDDEASSRKGLAQSREEIEGPH